MLGSSCQACGSAVIYIEASALSSSDSSGMRRCSPAEGGGVGSFSMALAYTIVTGLMVRVVLINASSNSLVDTKHDYSEQSEPHVEIVCRSCT